MRQIQLNNGFFTQVDDADYDWLNQWKWYAGKSDTTYYAFRSEYKEGRVISIRMHRLILGIGGDSTKSGDHKDFNGLNNQRANLRLCTVSQNNCYRRSFVNSSSKYKGVSWDKVRAKWQAHIKKDKKLKRIGYYNIETDAALAYNQKARELHGEFAYLNVIAE